jgi:hypothetical protein
MLELIILTTLAIVGVGYYFYRYSPKVGDIVIVTDKSGICVYQYTGIITSVKESKIIVDCMLYETIRNQNALLDTGVVDNSFDLSDKNVFIKLLIKTK